MTGRAGGGALCSTYGMLVTARSRALHHALHAVFAEQIRSVPRAPALKRMGRRSPSVSLYGPPSPQAQTT